MSFVSEHLKKKKALSKNTELTLKFMFTRGIYVHITFFSPARDVQTPSRSRYCYYNLHEIRTACIFF